MPPSSFSVTRQWGLGTVQWYGCVAASALQLLVGARVDVALDQLVGVVVGVLLLPCGSGLFIHTFSNSNFAAE